MIPATSSPSSGTLAPATVLFIASFVLALGVLAAEPPTTPEWPLACSFFPPDADEVSRCARREHGEEIVVRTDVFPTVDEPHAVHALVVEGELLFALANGKTAPALAFDNGPDYFRQGLARTIRDGKIGFVNGQLDVVIPRVWDFAFPFEDGVAPVCNGCVSVRQPPKEHAEVLDGLWGYIDRSGNVVVPVEYARDLLPPSPARLAEAADAGLGPSWSYVIRQWGLRVAVLLMAMVILGFLGLSALFLPLLGAWFIYRFLLPFLFWIPGMIFGPAAGWTLAGVWLAAFPAMRWWATKTPSGKRVAARYLQWWTRFGSGDPQSGSWISRSSARSSGSVDTTPSTGSSDLSGRGGRFGGGGSSGRW